MARHVRIEYPGAAYHITSRGNAREKIFLDDEDRKAFLDILIQAVQQHNIVLHSYCLMDNHYHLLLETPEGNLSIAMRQINGIYTQKFNRHHKRCGHVFQGRYKAVLVDKESYLLELCRYIALNPVRAGIVKGPEDYRWSSYRATIGKEEPLKGLNPDWLLSNFSPDAGKAAARYEQFVKEGMNRTMDIPEGSIAIGGESFLNEIKERAKESGLEQCRSERYINRPDLKSIFSAAEDTKSRNRAIYMAYVEHAYTQREIAAHLGLSHITVCRAVKETRC